MEKESNFNLVQFEQSIEETCFAFINSPTRGISLLTTMLLYEEDPTILESLIASLESKAKEGFAEENKTVRDNLINNLKFIKNNLTNKEAHNLIKEVRANLLEAIVG
jgi:hypothetical protein